MTSFVSSPLRLANPHSPLATPRRRQRSQRHPYCVTRPSLEDVRRSGFRELRVGGIVVPRHRWNPLMRQKGVYRSVEYLVERLTLDDTSLSTTRELRADQLQEVEATLRPLNRLLPRYERKWPVRVLVADAKLLPYGADLLSCAVVTVALSATFLLLGVLGPQYASIYSIPSSSMFPTLRVGDALLVEKLSLRRLPPMKGEIILFRPPRRLLNIMHAAHEGEGSGAAQRAWSANAVAMMRRNDLFVKRVVAVAGDVIEVHGKDVQVNGVTVDSAAPGSPDVAPRRIPDGFIFVVGDNPERSLDSRYWGLLPVEYVVGRPVARIFPLDRLDIRI